MNWQNYIIILTAILSLNTIEVYANITVCIPLEKIKNDKDYSSLIKYFKLKATSSLESDNSTKYFDHLEFKFQHPAISAEGELNEVYVANLNDFSLKYFQNVDIAHHTMDLFDLRMHNISVQGKYKLNGNIGSLFDIFGEGDFWLNLNNFSVSAKSGFPSINKTAACITMEINPKLESVDGWFDKFMNDDELEEVVNHAMLRLLPEAVEVIWSEFKDVLEEAIQELIQSIINGGSMARMLSKVKGIQEKYNLTAVGDLMV